MNRFMKYAVIAASVAMIVAPSVALAVTQPTLPPGVGGSRPITTSTIETLINSIVNFLITISVIVAVGYIVWAGIQIIRGGWEAGKKTLLNGVIGVAVILGVGLILSTVARFVSTGGSIN